MHIYSTSLEMVKLARNWNQRASSASQRSHEETVTACDWLNWTSSDSLHVKYFSARENKSLMYSKQSPQRSASGRHLGATWSGFGDDTICHHQVCEALAAWHELWVELYRPHWHSHPRSQQHTHTHRAIIMTSAFSPGFSLCALSELDNYRFQAFCTHWDLNLIQTSMNASAQYRLFQNMLDELLKWLR